MNGILIPQNIFVGDSAQFLFLLSDPEYVELTARQFNFGDSLPLKDLVQNNEMTVQNIQIIERENRAYLHVTFIPWETGEINFPSLSSLKLETVLPSVHVSSLLEEAQGLSLQPPKPPLLLPGTDYLLYGLAAGCVGCLLLFSVGISLLLRKITRTTVFHAAKKRVTTLRRTLKYLYKEARKIQSKTTAAEAADTDVHAQEKIADQIRRWYAAFDRAVRSYLCALFAEDAAGSPDYNEGYFVSATYSELIEKLTVLFRPHRKIPDLFAIFYTMLEQQRFAGNTPKLVRNYTAVACDLLKKVPYIAEKTEAEYAALLHFRKESAEMMQHAEAASPVTNSSQPRLNGHFEKVHGSSP